MELPKSSIDSIFFNHQTQQPETHNQSTNPKTHNEINKPKHLINAAIAARNSESDSAGLGGIVFGTAWCFLVLFAGARSVVFLICTNRGYHRGRDMQA
nr:hypothetical protein CFP56_28134 [Quercus suber]